MKSTTLPTLFCLGLTAVVGCGDNADSIDDPDADPPAPDAPIEPDAPPAARVGLSTFDFQFAVDVTPDGKTAVFEGVGVEVFEAILYFHDTLADQVTEMTVVGDPLRHIVTGVSATGRVSALHAEPVQAGLWAPGGDWLDLGSPHPAGCGEDLSGGFDVSADGAVTVGLTWDGCTARAFRWTDAGGSGAFTLLEVLGTPLGGGGAPTNRASVISDDGRIAAGFASNAPLDRTPALWNPDGTGFLIDPDEHDAPGEVLSISADGSVAAGIKGYDGFVWTAAGGMVILPRLEVSLPSDAVYPNAMSADGSLVFGGVGNSFFSIPIAFVWSAEHGTRALADVATAAGIAIPDGMILGNVLGASADGLVLVGTATTAEFTEKSFTLRLPANAYDQP